MFYPVPRLPSTHLTAKSRSQGNVPELDGSDCIPYKLAASRFKNGNLPAAFAIFKHAGTPCLAACTWQQDCQRRQRKGNPYKIPNPSKFVSSAEKQSSGGHGWPEPRRGARTPLRRDDSFSSGKIYCNRHSIWFFVD